MIYLVGNPDDVVAWLDKNRPEWMRWPSLIDNGIYFILEDSDGSLLKHPPKQVIILSNPSKFPRWTKLSKPRWEVSYGTV